MTRCSVFFVLLGFLLVGCSSSEESARKLHNEAMNLQQAGNYEEAKTIYRVALEVVQFLNAVGDHRTSILNQIGAMR